MLFFAATGGVRAKSSPQAPSIAKLQVRLLDHLTSYRSRPGTPFRCIVIAPFDVQGETLIPAGSIVFGTVKHATSIRLGLVHERAWLDLTFSSYQDPAGSVFPLAAKLSKVENAREDVMPSGKIRGILAAQKPEQVLNGFWERPALNTLYHPFEGLTGVGPELLERIPLGPLAPAVMIALRCAVLRFPEPEIHLVPGTDMELAVDTAHTGFVPKPALAELAAAPDLDNWLGSHPLNIDFANGRPAPDSINVAFIGSKEDLINGFLNAGWYGAQPSNFHSLSHAYAAFDAKRAYHEMPVSRLLYEDREPDLVFEKSFDTVLKRHHVRIWKVDTFDGQPVWMGAATHDIGIALRRRLFPLSHAIDTRLDSERDKIVTDLVFAGCSSKPEYAEVGADSFDEKHPVVTDGRIAVLTLRSCEQSLPMLQEAPPAPGNRASRFVRRIILESRDYVLRENAYYLTFLIVRHAFSHSAARTSPR